MNSSSNSSYAYAFGMWYYGDNSGSVSEAMVNQSTGGSVYFGVAYFGKPDSGYGPNEQDVAFGGIYESSLGAGVNYEHAYPEFNTGSGYQNTPVGKLFI